MSGELSASDITKMEVEAILSEIGTLLAGSTITPQDAYEYVSCFRDAAQVHVDRERIRRGLWKDYDADDQIRQAFIKSDRIRKILEIAHKESRGLTSTEMDEIGSECDDIINYATFTKRSL